MNERHAKYAIEQEHGNGPEKEQTRGHATEVARRFLALVPELRQWMTGRVQVIGDGDLGLRQYAALCAIRTDHCSPGELARQWQVTPAVLTGVVDRLEQRGLIRREADATDRRRQRLVLTDSGAAAAETFELALVGDLAAKLADTSPDDLAAIERAVDVMQHVLVALHGRKTAGAPPCAQSRVP